MKIILKYKHIIFSMLLLISAICLSLRPIDKILTALDFEGRVDAAEESGLDEMYDYMANIDKYRQSDQFEHFHSEHFKIYLTRNYMTSEQVNQYLERMEDYYNEVIAYLNYEELEEDKEPGKMNIFLLDEPGVSFCGGPSYFVVRDYLSGIDCSVHEMTHALDYRYREMLIKKHDNKENIIHSDFTKNFIQEQRAELVEKDISPYFAYPNYGFPVNSFIYARLRNKIELEPLEELNTKTLLMVDHDEALSEFRYIAAGSFGRYLMETYGAETYNLVATRGYEGAYNKQLVQLEQEWHSWLRLGSLMQSILLVIGGLLVLGASHIWLLQREKKFWLWLPAVIMGVLAFLAWGFYLNFSENELWGILLAITAGGLLKIWKPKIGITALWILGIAGLFIQLILPVF